MSLETLYTVIEILRSLCSVRGEKLGKGWPLSSYVESDQVKVGNKKLGSDYT